MLGNALTSKTAGLLSCLEHQAAAQSMHKKTTSESTEPASLCLHPRLSIPEQVSREMEMSCQRAVCAWGWGGGRLWINVCNCAPEYLHLQERASEKPGCPPPGTPLTQEPSPTPARVLCSTHL